MKSEARNAVIATTAVAVVLLAIIIVPILRHRREAGARQQPPWREEFVVPTADLWPMTKGSRGTSETLKVPINTMSVQVRLHMDASAPKSIDVAVSDVTKVVRTLKSVPVRAGVANCVFGPVDLPPGDLTIEATSDGNPIANYALRVVP